MVPLEYHGTTTSLCRVTRMTTLVIVQSTDRQDGSVPVDHDGSTIVLELESLIGQLLVNSNLK